MVNPAVATTWAWRVRMEKRSPPPDYNAMTTEMWANFDKELRKHLMAGDEDRAVEVTAPQMEKQYDRLTAGFRHAIETAVPKRKKVKFDGRKASAKTKALFEQRIRDYSTGRKITKSDRKAWNKVISAACKQDYHDWLQRWITKIEQADINGDAKAVSQGVNTISGASRTGFSKKPVHITRTPTTRRRATRLQGRKNWASCGRAFWQASFRRQNWKKPASSRTSAPTS